MKFRRSGTTYVLRLDKGEELVGTLTSFMRKFGITAGCISGIGAADAVTLGFFDTGKNEYLKQTFSGDYEILNLSGNVTMLEANPFIHLHAVISDREYAVTGGHLFSANISVTGEIFLFSLDTRIERAPDEETNLNLIKL